MNKTGIHHHIMQTPGHPLASLSSRFSRMFMNGEHSHQYHDLSSPEKVDHPLPLSIRDLHLMRNHRTLLKDLTHDFCAQNIYALVGKNGCGKTTLLKAISGLVPVKRGQLLIDGVDILDMPLRRRAQLISYLLQHSHKHPYCLGSDRIAQGMVPTWGYDYRRIDTDKYIEDVAQRLNIYHLLKRPLSHMSGGELRMVNIAKCLLDINAKILLLDEPSAHLDFSQQQCLISSIKQQASLGQLVIFSSHNAHFIKRCADMVIKIHNGKTQVITMDQWSSSSSFLDMSDDRASSTISPL